MHYILNINWHLSVSSVLVHAVCQGNVHCFRLIGREVTCYWGTVVFTNPERAIWIQDVFNLPVYLQKLETVCVRHTNIYEGLSRLMTANLRKVTKSFFILPFIVLYTKHADDISHQEKRKALAKGKIKCCIVNTVN